MCSRAGDPCRCPGPSLEKAEAENPALSHEPAACTRTRRVWGVEEGHDGRRDFDSSTAPSTISRKGLTV